MQIDTNLVPEGVRFVAATLREAGFKAWIVGGCVRDLLRGAGDQISDWDLTTDARPEQVTNLFARVIPTGIQHGTVTVMHMGEGFEVTTLRGEGAYSDGRRPDEVFFVDSIELDLMRRDFSCNAIAADPVSGTVTDPFGGLEDLRNGVLRAVGNAHDRFSEDGLRVLRAARFCAVLNCTLDADTEFAIRPNLPTFAKVAKERVLAEWVKATEKCIFRYDDLTGQAASNCPSTFFKIMERTGILEVLGGPLARMDNLQFHRAMVRLDSCASRYFEHSMAAMLLESNATDKEIDTWLRELTASNQSRELILTIVSGLRGAPKFVEMIGLCAMEPAKVRRWAAKIGVRYLTDAILVYTSNPFGGVRMDAEELNLEFSTLLHHTVPLELKGLAVSGDELQEQLGIPPSRKLGELLKGLMEFVLDDPTRNEKEVLLSHARTLL